MHGPQVFFVSGERGMEVTQISQDNFPSAHEIQAQYTNKLVCDTYSMEVGTYFYLMCIKRKKKTELAN